MGGQRELRRHEPKWHLAPVRSLRAPTHADGRNSDADTNCQSNVNRNGYGHSDCNGDGDSYSYSYSNGYFYPDSHSDIHPYTDCYSHSYANANFDTQTYAHTEACANCEAAPDAGTPSVKRNAEDLIRKAGTQENPSFFRAHGFLTS